MQTISFLKFNFLLNTIMLLFAGLVSTYGTTTYKLTAVTSVSKNNKYVFVEDGHALTIVSSKILQSTSSFSSTGLYGTENYVWLLEESTHGFYLKNCSTSTYLNNSSKTDMSLGTKSSEWTFSFGVSSANILNYSNSNRYIGETSDNVYTYKAYSESGHANNFTIYRLDEEPTCISLDPINGSIIVMHTFIISLCQCPFDAFRCVHRTQEGGRKTLDIMTETK